MKPWQSYLYWGAVALIVVAFISAFLERATGRDIPNRQSDIHAIYLEGVRICAGENPYSRIHIEGREDISKPPVYLPGFYLFGCLGNLLGFSEYRSWMNWWGVVNVATHIGIGLLITALFFRSSAPVLGLFFLLVWLLGRWSSFSLITYQQNTVALLPLLVALTVFTRHPRLSLILVGTSLAIKQLAVFAIPAILGAWLARHPNPRDLLRGLLLLALVPTILSLPFFLHDPVGMWQSITYSALRDPTGTIRNRLLEHLEPVGRWLVFIAPMLLGVVTFRRQLGIATASFLAMVAFISFNLTVFNQYIFWALALLPFAIREQLEQRDSRSM